MKTQTATAPLALAEPRKFAAYSTATLESVQTHSAAKMYAKVKAGEKLSREEKNSLYEQLSSNSYSKTGVPVLGWMFDFGGYLKRYMVATDFSTTIVWAPDKTSIRESIYHSGIREIVQLP